MADIASQALSIGALLLALVTPRRGRRWLALAAGALIGFAFDVRYTQVLIAPAIALGLWLAPDALRRERLIRVGLAAAGALCAALPVLAYHAWAFGGPFTTGSDELQHFSLAGVPGMLARTLIELGWYREFGLIAPLMALGAWALPEHGAGRGGSGHLTLPVLPSTWPTPICASAICRGLPHRDDPGGVWGGPIDRSDSDAQSGHTRDHSPARVVGIWRRVLPGLRHGLSQHRDLPTPNHARVQRLWLPGRRATGVIRDARGPDPVRGRHRLLAEQRGDRSVHRQADLPAGDMDNG
jgi:hypothetical protein